MNDHEEILAAALALANELKANCMDENAVGTAIDRTLKDPDGVNVVAMTLQLITTRGLGMAALAVADAQDSVKETLVAMSTGALFALGQLDQGPAGVDQATAHLASMSRIDAAAAELLGDPEQLRKYSDGSPVYTDEPLTGVPEWLDETRDPVLPHRRTIYPRPAIREAAGR